MSQFQDIIPPEKRSIRNVPLSNASKKISKKSAVSREPAKIKKLEVMPEVTSEEPKDPWSYEPKDDLKMYGGGGSIIFSNGILWLVTIGSVILLLFSISWIFAGATINIKLKKVSIDLPTSIPYQLSPKEGEVGYSSITFKESASTELVPKGKKEVQSRSSGTVVIYNNHNTSPQKLVAGTRLETGEGLIYKLDQAVTVPGKNGEVPGAVEAKATASEAGPKYNIGLADFTIPGFKNDPRYKNFYARSKSPMTGGNSGLVAIVEDVELAKSVEGLKNEISRQLKEKVSKELPKNQITFDTFQTISWQMDDPVVQGDKAILRVTGEAKVHAIDSSSLARYLLSKKEIAYSENDVFSLDTSGVVAELDSGATSTLKASLKGSVVIGYTIDNEKFRSEVAGRSKTDVIKVVASNYPQVTSLSTVVKPFWHSSLPQDPAKISVIED